MFHKDISTGNVVKCSLPELCTISTIHADSRNLVEKLYLKSEKQLSKIDKLSKSDAQILLQRKEMESAVISRTVKNLVSNIDRFAVVDGSTSPSVSRLRLKLDALEKVQEKIDENILLLSYRLEN